MRKLWRIVYWNLIHPFVRRRQIHEAARGDRKKIEAVAFVQPYTMVGFVRLINAYDLVQRVEEKQLPGVLVECGVYKGGTSAMMIMAASPGRRLWMFDSFEGLPEPTAEDGAMAKEYSGDRNSGALAPIDRCVGPLDVVHELFFERLHVDRSRIEIRKGWFQDTLPIARREIGPIAVLRLDGDWYDSTNVCLENLYDNVVDGGFVIIDDYQYWEGCKRAVGEFIASRGLAVKLVVVDDSAVYWEKS